jgi:hypothetical protein
MLSPPPPHLRTRSRIHTTNSSTAMYNHSSFAMSAPNILRSRGESVPIGRSFPGNIPGEYESDQDQEQDQEGMDEEEDGNDEEYQDGYEYHHGNGYAKDGREPGSATGTHLITPYLYPSSRSRQTSSSTTTSYPYAQPSPSYSIPSSHKTLPNPGSIFGQPHSQPNSRGRKFRRPGTGSTVASTNTNATDAPTTGTPSSTRSPLSQPHSLSGPYSHAQSQTHRHTPPPSHTHGHTPAFTATHSELQTVPSLPQILPIPATSSTTNIPLSPTPHTPNLHLSKRLAPIYTFLTSPDLEMEQGVLGLQEWVDFWVGRGVRVRDLTRDLAGLVKGSVSRIEFSVIVCMLE